jgi:hypothetical protein
VDNLGYSATQDDVRDAVSIARNAANLLCREPYRPTDGLAQRRRAA